MAPIASVFRRVTREQVEKLRRLPATGVLRALGVEQHRLPAIAAELRQRAEAEASRFQLFDGMPELIRAFHPPDRFAIALLPAKL